MVSSKQQLKRLFLVACPRMHTVDGSLQERMMQASRYVFLAFPHEQLAQRGQRGVRGPARRHWSELHQRRQLRGQRFTGTS